MEDNRKKKFAILGVASVVLMAMVVFLIAMVNENSDEKFENSKNGDDVTASIKAVCHNTDYKNTCIESLSESNTQSTDPKELIKTTFEITVNQLESAAKNSSLMQDLHKDPRTDDALKGCQELVDLAIRDLRRSFEKMDSFDLNEFSEAIVDLKIWLSGAMTYEQTCLDGFEKTEGDAGEKMKKVLKKSMELTSNGLAMITDMSQALQSLEVPQTSSNRRLLSLFSYDHDIPEWVDDRGRSVLEKETLKIDPDLTVAMDGSGNFKSINEALNVVPVKRTETYVLYIKEGIYREIVKVPKNLTRLMVIGDGPDKTKITGSLNFIDGVTTYHTATLAVSGEFFIAQDIGFENTAGPEKHQAVALRVSADKSIFYNCRMDGFQDTLYAHTYRQFYRDCTISGTIDFIFGDAVAVFQNCIIIVRKPMDNQNCIVTAQGRKDSRQPTGTVLQNCTIVADPVYFPVRMELKSYLARPWKEYSRTIIMETFIDDLIQPQGWLPWNETFAFNTLFYTEFNNRGPGSSKLQRARWPGVKELPARRIERFTPGKFITGDKWVPLTNVPYISEFVFEPPKDDSKNNYSKESEEEDRDDTPNLNKKKKKKKEKKQKKEKDSKSLDEAKTPAESPGFESYRESEISAPGSSPTLSPQASPEAKKETFLKKIFGKFKKH